MTIIAYRDGLLCCDSRLSAGTFIEDDRETKIFRLSDGSLIGYAGTYRYILQLHALMKKAAKTEKALPQVSLRKTWALHISPGKKVSLYDCGTWFQNKFVQPYYAIGSGDQVAMAAMDAGADALTATKIAIKRVPSCGGRIHKLEL